ncbi:hypothetical protein P0082_04105 [Candidatus Haliotispira prima]|uniref:Uncharacterized protein n=1 Tax=Candidatus Haliotispira prima TaxID=3034016 RepID=A0ABY8MJI3_9SPIO|nr:hypothetical protein P0082_04105 [Candidatus Haliotispira prima]
MNTEECFKVKQELSALLQKFCDELSDPAQGLEELNQVHQWKLDQFFAKYNIERARQAELIEQCHQL